MAKTRVSLKKTSGAPKAKSSRIILIPYGEVVTWPSRSENDVLVTGDLELAEGAKAIGMYATASTISRADTQEGDPDAEGFMQTLTFDHPGNALETEEFIQKYIGEPFIAISDECGDGYGTRVHGWKCNPVYFSLEEQDNNEGVKKTLTWSTRLRTRFKSGIYKGVIPAFAAEAAEGPEGGL